MHGRLGQRQQASVASRNAYNGSSRLFAAAIQQPEKATLSKFDARLKLSGQTSGKMLDARQKLQQKTKFADARERIEKKKLQVHSEAASDMRQKLLAKRRLSVNTDASTSVSTTSKQSAAGLQLTKSTPMLVTVSNQGRIASSVSGNTSSAGNKTVTTNPFTSSRLVSFSVHRAMYANSVITVTKFLHSNAVICG